MNLNLYKIFSLFEKYFTKDKNYLIGMTIYHFEILFLVVYLGLNLNTHVWLPMITPDKAGSMNFLNYHVGFNVYAIGWTLSILFVDFLFLYIIRREIKSYERTHHKKLIPTIPYINYNIELNTKEIMAIEAIIFFISIGNPIMRASLYFLSFNTIQIYIIYRIFFKIDHYLNIAFFRPMFIFACYYSIAYLIIYPIYILLMLKLKIG